MADFVDKITELRRYFPKPFYNLKPGQGLSIAIEAVGGQLNDLASQQKNARDQFLLARAGGIYLEAIGNDLDVFKPAGYNMSDDTYRQLIEIISNSPKNIEYIFERILALYFGPHAIDMGICDVYSYQPNQMIVQIQSNALIIASNRNLYGTTYLHRGDTSSNPAGVWNGTLSSPLPLGSTSVTLSPLPAGVPVSGIITFGPATAPDESKGFDRSGSVLTFYSPTLHDHPSGQVINGPIDSDDFHSGYIYDSELRSDLVGSYAAGASTVTIGAFPQNIPVVGTVYIGTPGNFNYEAKGYTKPSLLSTTLNLKGTLAFPHSSGDPIIVPNMPRSVNTTLNQTITAGSSYAEVSVVNGADFPLQRQAIRFAQSFGNEEIVPLISRKLSDNTKLQIDPGYTFVYDHSVGEKVQLMAMKTTPSTDGLNWPFYLNDTDSLRAQFFNMLRRLKATGVKIVFDIV